MPVLIPLIAAGVAAYGAGAVSAALIAAGYSALTAAIVSAVAGAVIAGVAAYGLNALAGGSDKPKPTASSASDRKQMTKLPVASRVLVYGRARISGNLVYVASSGAKQEFLHLVLVLTTHEVADLGTIWLNDKAIGVNEFSPENGIVTSDAFAGKVRMVAYRGNQTTANPELIAESPDGWSADHKLLGCAYLYLRLEYDQDKFASGIPNVTVEVQGKNAIYDPRTGTAGYSRNPALCILDYLRSTDGFAASDDEIDVASFIIAANECDEMVDLNEAGTSQQPRYRLDGSFTLDAAPIDILESMLTTLGGTLTYVQGRYRLHAGAYEAPTDTLTVADLAGPIELEANPARATVFNSVRGTFIDPVQNWQQNEFPAWKDAALIAADGETIWQDLDLPFTIDGTAAQRLAKMTVDRAREGLTIRCPVRYAGLRYQVWQTLSVTIPQFGFAAKPFRINSFTFDPISGVVSLMLREESAASYAWLFDDASEFPEAPDTTLINPLDIPAPTDLLVVASTVLQADGAVVPALEVTWTASAHAFVRAHEVQWRISAGPGEWSSAEVPAGTNRFVIAPVIVGQQMDVRVRALGGLVRGAWTSILNGTGAPDVTAPAPPSGIVGVGLTRAVSIRWVNPPDRDLRHVEIWESATSGGVFGKVGEARTDFFVRSGFMPNETRYFRLRSVDLSYNMSAFADSGPVTSTLLIADDIADGILNTAKFAASIAPVGLVMGVPGSAVIEGGRVVDVIFDTVTDKVYRWNGSAYTAAVPAIDVSGTLSDAQIGDLAAAKLTGQITATQIADGSISTPKLQAGAVQTANLAAGAVTTESLAVGSAAGNLIFNANLAHNIAGWAAGGNNAPTDWGPAADPWRLINQGSGYAHRTHLDPFGYMDVMWLGHQQQTGHKVPVAGGEWWEFQALVQAHRCSVALVIAWYDGAGNYITENYLTGSGGEFATSNGYYPTSYKPLWGKAQAPAGAGSAMAFLRATATTWGQASPADPFIFFTRTLFARSHANQTIPSPWTPGGVTEINGGMVRAGSIEADNLATNSITSDKIVANAVTFGKVAAGAIRAGEIFAGELRAIHMASETIITQAAQMGTAVIGTATIIDLTVDTIKIKGNAVSNIGAAGWAGSASPLSFTDLVAATASDPNFGGTLLFTVFLAGDAQEELVGSGGEGGYTLVRGSYEMRVLLNNVEVTVEQQIGGKGVLSYQSAAGVGPGTHTVMVQGRVGGAGTATLLRAIVSVSLIKK